MRRGALLILLVVAVGSFLNVLRNIRVPRGDQVYVFEGLAGPGEPRRGSGWFTGCAASVCPSS
jgi:hypothetical protein